MAFPDVIIRQISKRSGKPLPGYDYYSGFVFYGTVPSVTGKWASYVGASPDPNINAQQLFSITDATSAGIIPYTDNTAATGTYLITAAAAAAGETVNPKITAPRPNSTTEIIDLGSYVTVSGDTVIDTLGANLVIFINVGTITHGYSASYDSATNTLTITAPKSEAKCLNSGTPISFTNSGDVDGTITQFSGGTASQWAIWYYHIAEYFAEDPNGNVWVSITASSTSFKEIKTLQKQAAASKIRQIGIYDTDATRGLGANISGTALSAHNACDALQQKQPLIGIYSPNMYGITDLSTYTDQNLNTAGLIQCVISQDGDAAGALLFIRNQQTVGNIGTKLGTISKSRVSASDAQPIADFNVSDGTENKTMAFGNGDLSTAVSENLQVQLDNYRYTFFRQFADDTVGTYWTGNKMCITNTSKYANVNDVRTYQRISRTCRRAYLPLLNSELYFNGDGTFKDYTVETFQDTGEDAITADMITGFANTPLISGVDVTIDPTQNVKATENLVVDVEYDQNGIARNITVNVGAK